MCAADPTSCARRAALPTDWDASLLAVDGLSARDVLPQLRHVPRDASHLVVSAGGNDALGASHLLAQSVAICDADEDYANPIEPSVRGGAKIASAIAAWVASGNPAGYATVITLRPIQ